MFRESEYLRRDAGQHAGPTPEEHGVLALVRGLDTYTRYCAPKYADACAAIEFGVGDLFQTARGMLNYAPDSLDRGALDAHLAELCRAWKISPDTYQWEGE